jgi:transcriptional regulator of arginine metabolism
MTDGRQRRQKVIADIIRREAVGSQEDVTARLAGHGLSVTQATVSRDLDQMGAVKVKRGGVLRYSLPDEIGDSDWAAARLQRIMSDWVQSIEAAGNMIVMKTPPGSAHLVGLALDQARLPEIAGTVCGDDTIFLVVREGSDPTATADRFRDLAGG